jgi:hypothetical protein
VHAPHEVVHACELLRALVHHEVDAVVNRCQIGVGDDAGNLHDRVLTNVEPRHFEIEPHQPAVVPTIRHHHHATAGGTGRFRRR